MYLLKKEYWWTWLLFFLFGSGISPFILGAFLEVYDSDAWYTKKEYWLLGLLCFIFPFFIMLTIFNVQITIEVARKLNVKGSDLYSSPYLWLLFIIVPIIGWFMISFLILYLNIAIIVALKKGEGEYYI